MSKQDIPGRSLLLDLENAVLAIESAGHGDEDIHAFVNMILKGFITNGTWTPEYLQMVADIIEEKRRAMNSRTVSTPPGLVGANGLPIQ